MRLFPAVLAIAGAVTAQTVIVIPNGFAFTEGNSSNQFPWGRGTGGIRIQTVYDSSHFTLQGITAPVMITRLRWRPNTNVVSAASSYPVGGTVRLSTCPVDQANVGVTFATNQGPDVRIVHEGPVSWPANTNMPGPCPFLIDIPLQHNFVYDPSAGDLNIETDIPNQPFTGSALPLDVTTANALSCRVYLTTGYANGGANAIGTINGNHGVVVEVTAVPAIGVFADFTASPRQGGTPLLVNFTDQSFSSHPVGVLAWNWDFDGDSVIDSQLQNPTHTYTACGTYTVSLTVFDAVHPPSTKTFQNLVATDFPSPDFTTVATGPTSVQFTDTTSPPATSWAWDLDGDSLVDSTLQNPTWTYATQCAAPTPVTLTVHRLCRGPVSITKPVRVASSLATLSNGGTSYSTGGGNYFDVNVTNPQGVTVCALDTKTTAAVSTPVTVEVWQTDGSHVGKELNAQPWRLVATGTGTGTGSGAAAPTVFVTLSNRFHLPFGLHGILVRITAGGGPLYHGVGNTFGNADLTFTLGAAQQTPWVSIVATPRTWNGAFHYTTTGTAGTGGYGFFGPGCAGSRAVSRLTATGQPRLGQTLQVDASNLPLSAAIMIVGLSRTSSLFGPLPVDLTPFGAPGCNGRVSVDASVFLAGTGNAASWNLAIPNSAVLLATQFFNQALIVDPGFNGLGAVISDASAAIIGNH